MGGCPVRTPSSGRWRHNQWPELAQGTFFRQGGGTEYTEGSRGVPASSAQNNARFL